MVVSTKNSVQVAVAYVLGEAINTYDIYMFNYVNIVVNPTP